MSKRQASFEVRIPTHVPRELVGLWQAAAQHTENKSQLRTASGRLNYTKVNENYKKLLAGYLRLAQKAESR